MLFIFSTPVLIKWQLKTVVFLRWCLICALLLDTIDFEVAENREMEEVFRNYGGKVEKVE
jgi:hypothetical protein